VAAEIKQTHGVEARLIEGKGGVFVIRQDGRAVYDKAETGRFPAPGEASRLLG
jgi:predicted Rdx family selenoprotein